MPPRLDPTAHAMFCAQEYQACTTQAQQDAQQSAGSALPPPESWVMPPPPPAYGAPPSGQGDQRADQASHALHDWYEQVCSHQEGQPQGHTLYMGHKNNPHQNTGTRKTENSKPNCRDMEHWHCPQPPHRCETESRHCMPQSRPAPTHPHLSEDPSDQG